MVCTSAPLGLQESKYVQITCLFILGLRLTWAYGFPSLGATLSWGLLGAIASCARHLRSDLEIQILRHWLGDLLPAAAVYHSVLGHLDTAIRQTGGLELAETFAAPEVADDWRAFIELVNERLQVKNYFDSSEYIATRACDDASVRRFMG